MSSASPTLVQPAGSFLGAFNLDSANGDARGIATDGSTIWVVDRHDHRVYSYSTAGTALGSFALATGNTEAEGIAFDGSVLYVVNDDTCTAFKYQTDGAALGSFSYNFSGAHSDPRGITVANGQVYVVDDSRQVYAGTEAAGFSLAFTLPSANNDPQGIAGFSP